MESGWQLEHVTRIPERRRLRRERAPNISLRSPLTMNPHVSRVNPQAGQGAGPRERKRVCGHYRLTVPDLMYDWELFRDPSDTNGSLSTRGCVLGEGVNYP